LYNNMLCKDIFLLQH